MNEQDFVWEHFKFNAEQRLKGFHFFILLSIFADGGVFAAIGRNASPVILAILGGFVMVLAVVFYIVDARSQNLLRLTIPALRKYETEFKNEESKLFKTDEAEQGKFIRYTTAIRILLGTQFLFGLGVLIYSACQLCG